MLYAVAGYLEKQKEFVEKTLLPKIEKFGEVKVISSPEEVEYPAIIFVGSGGTGSLLCKIAKRGPCLFVAHGENNSLPSALEGKFRVKDTKAKIVYTDTFEELPKEVFIWQKIAKYLRQKKRIGIIGELKKEITNEEKEILKKLNCEIVRISLDEFVKLVGEGKNEAWKTSKEALEKLVKEKNLHAITMRCFSLINHGFVPCYGASCIGSKIPFTCEGDLQALITMLLVRSFCETPLFMANTTRVCPEHNTVLFSHCTIPWSMIKNHEIVSHMESGLHGAVRGDFKAESVTIVRWNDNKLCIAQGKVIKSNMKLENLCRMQIEVKMKMDVNKWIENCLGNHQIIVPGNIEKELRELSFIFGFKTS